MSLYDALKAEADARDAALWREHGARLMEALDVAIHRLHYVVDPFTGDSNDNSGLHATLAAAREAAGKEDGNG